MAHVQEAAREKKPAKVESGYEDEKGFLYCSASPKPERAFEANVTSLRMSLINTFDDKWVNGTVLHYYFFDRQSDGENVVLADGSTEWRPWTANDEPKQVVRQAFDLWKDLGIGIDFKEVGDREDAEIRIGFMQGDGSWSYLGRGILNYGPNKRTMNFGWDLTRSPQEIDTAIHEIGHTLGFPHEHQNPKAGIVWNEEEVYQRLSGPPNFWSRSKTEFNIIRKIRPDSVQGTSWDPNSIMHYPFGAGLIKEPEQYARGLFPEAGLSDRDKTWAKTLYPAVDPHRYPDLKPFSIEQLEIAEGQQVDFSIEPETTRSYQMRTFGNSDTVMVLFEDDNGDLRYMTADDDSGTAYNSHLTIKLFKGRRYVLRVRLYYSDDSGRTAVMLW